jgi:hypothetical protein
MLVLVTSAWLTGADPAVMEAPVVTWSDQGAIAGSCDCQTEYVETCCEKPHRSLLTCLRDLFHHHHDCDCVSEECGDTVEGSCGCENGSCGGTLQCSCRCETGSCEGPVEGPCGCADGSCGDAIYDGSMKGNAPAGLPSGPETIGPPGDAAPADTPSYKKMPTLKAPATRQPPVEEPPIVVVPMDE